MFLYANGPVQAESLFSPVSELLWEIKIVHRELPALGRKVSVNKKLHALKADLWEASSHNKDSCMYFQVLVL